MTLVNTETGELVDALSEVDAERLSNKISLRLDTIADNYTAVVPMIREAIQRQAHVALGYRSPGEYAADRFGDALSKLGAEMRQAVVRELADLGMSTRAIAPIVGVSQKTVVKDTQVIPRVSPLPAFAEHMANYQTPEPVEDGEAEAGSGQTPGDGPVVTSTPAPVRPPVTGIDGKTYAPPKAVAPTLSRSPEQVNAEENSQHLARSLIFLLAFQHPNMRDHARGEWEAGRFAVSPTNRGYVTPNHMREAAAGLASLADEWESQ